MRVSATELPEVLLVEPDIHGDARGFFLETWRVDRYRKAGVGAEFVQDNVSRSMCGVLRGLHLQHPQGQGKLLQVVDGEAFDVAVDVRRGSERFGRWVGATLSGDNHHQLWIPPGFAHGFCVTADHAVFSYKCTAVYSPETEFSVAWDDPAIGIEWPVSSPTLSDKDRNAPRLSELAARLPHLGDY